MKTRKSKEMSMKISHEVLDMVRKLAKSEGRTLKGQIERILRAAV